MINLFKTNQKQNKKIRPKLTVVKVGSKEAFVHQEILSLQLPCVDLHYNSAAIVVTIDLFCMWVAKILQTLRNTVNVLPFIALTNCYSWCFPWVFGNSICNYFTCARANYSNFMGSSVFALWTEQMHPIMWLARVY